MSRYDVDAELPRFQLPEKGVDAKVAYQLLHDELMLGESCACLSTVSVVLPLTMLRWEPEYEPGLVSVSGRCCERIIHIRQVRAHLGARRVHQAHGRKPQQGE
jgi:hypothetical protein